ncbi:hypothetical protein ES705_43344 [subsurface metagenome]
MGRLEGLKGDVHVLDVRRDILLRLLPELVFSLGAVLIEGLVGFLLFYLIGVIDRIEFLLVGLVARRVRFA